MNKEYLEHEPTNDIETIIKSNGKTYEIIFYKSIKFNEITKFYRKTKKTFGRDFKVIVIENNTDSLIIIKGNSLPFLLPKETRTEMNSEIGYCKETYYSKDTILKIKYDKNIGKKGFVSIKAFSPIEKFKMIRFI